MAKQSTLQLLLCACCIILNTALFAQVKQTGFQHSTTKSQLNGCWRRVRVIVNGNIDNNPPPQIRLYHDGFFSYIGMDSTGSWKIAYGGIYDFEDGIYMEKMRYSTYPDFTNGKHWQDLKMYGDTVSFTLFKKRIDSTGRAIPAPNYTRQLICVRVKD